MQFSVYINQVRAQEWGLNLSQTVLFSFLYEAHSWASEFIVDGQAYYWVAKEKICEELPILTDKPDTIKRLMAVLESSGLISRAVLNNLPLIRITEKGRLWNNTGSVQVGKKIPTSASSRAGKISLPEQGQGREKNPDQVGKKIPTGGEKNPPNQITISNNQDQTTTTPQRATDFGSAPSGPFVAPAEFSDHWQPMKETVWRIVSLSIPEEFIFQCVPEFVAYWLTAGRQPFGGNYETAFLKSVQRAWAQHQNNTNRIQRGASHGSVHAGAKTLNLNDTAWLNDYGKSPFDAPANPAGRPAGELAADGAYADFYEMAGGVDAGGYGRRAPGLAYDVGGAGRDE